MYNKVYCTCKVIFLLITDQLIFLAVFVAARRLAINDFIFCLSKLYININQSFAFSPG